MRILFVAMPNSVHTAGWINQVTDRGWDLHLFPCYDGLPHPDLRQVTFHSPACSRGKEVDPSVRIQPFWRLPKGSGTLSMVMQHCVPEQMRFERWLARTIRRIKPDLVHAMQIQHAGYLTLAARRYLGRRLPPWIITNYGSDIYLHGRLASHVERIMAVLKACDFYACECHRDIALARKLGFRGQVLPVLPISAGVDLKQAASLRCPGPPSARRLIMLKGYQDWCGRALVALQALEMCADVLPGYRVAIYNAPSEVALAAELVSRSACIPIDIVPATSRDAILHLFGQARVYLGLSISDGISTSLLEAMAMGAYPIQSSTACACEWITDGVSGSIVPPEDPHVVARALRRALTDDKLVDQAARLNERTSAERLDWQVLRPKAAAFYEQAYQQSRLGRG